MNEQTNIAKTDSGIEYVGGGNVSVAVRDPNEVKIEIAFKKMGHDILLGTLVIGEKYLELCKFIRLNQLAPKQVTAWLLDLGFHKSRAAEINRVAQSSDDIFSAYEARTIGWRGALKMSRGLLKEVSSVSPQAGLIFDVSGIASEVDAELIAEEERIKNCEAEDAKQIAGKTPAEIEAMRDAERDAARFAGMNRAAVALLRRAVVAYERKKIKVPFRWSLGVGLELVLQKTGDSAKISPRRKSVPVSVLADSGEK